MECWESFLKLFLWSWVIPHWHTSFCTSIGGLVVKPMCDMAIELTLSNNVWLFSLAAFCLQSVHTLGGTVGRTPQAGSSPTQAFWHWQSTRTAPLLRKAFLPTSPSSKGPFQKVSWHENSISDRWGWQGGRSRGSWRTKRKIVYCGRNQTQTQNLNLVSRIRGQ